MVALPLTSVAAEERNRRPSVSPNRWALGCVPPPTAIVTDSACVVAMLDEDGVTVTAGVALLTTWLKADALLAVKELPVLGVYTAVMLWVPAASVLVVYAAVPPLSATAEPTEFPSTPNCTVPVGVEVPLVAATVAVTVTD